MRIAPRPSVAALAVLSASVLLADAQQGAYSFHNFKNPGAGQYRQETQATRGGQPFGQPFSDTHCASTPSAQMMANVKQMANMAGSINNCTTRVLVDTPTLATAQQVCNPGALQTVIETTLRTVDARTITEDVHMTMGGQSQTDTHTRLTYLGACTAAQTAENARLQAQAYTMQMPAMPKPSKQECAEFKQQAAEGATMNCSEMPADYRSRCEAAKVMMQQQVKQMEAVCK